MSPAVKTVQIVLTIIGLSGIVLSFVPFGDRLVLFTNVLLGGDFLDFIWLLLTPCIILPVPISAGYILWLITGRLPRWALMASYVLSAWLVVSSLVAIIGAVIDDGVDFESLLFFFLIGAAFIGGVWFSIQGIRHESTVRGLVLMQSVYVAPMTYFVVSASIAGGIEHFGFGALLGAVTLLTYLLQIALAAKRFAWIMPVVIPMSCIAILLAVAIIAR